MVVDLAKTQQYLDWLKDKLYLNAIATTAKNRVITRGQVYRCKLGIGIGSEECKDRPCVVLQHNSANKSSPNTIVPPLHIPHLLFQLLYQYRPKQILQAE